MCTHNLLPQVYVLNVFVSVLTAPIQSTAQPIIGMDNQIRISEETSSNGMYVNKILDYSLTKQCRAVQQSYNIVVCVTFASTWHESVCNFTLTYHFTVHVRLKVYMGSTFNYKYTEFSTRIGTIAHR